MALQVTTCYFSRILHSCISVDTVISAYQIKTHFTMLECNFKSTGIVEALRRRKLIWEYLFQWNHGLKKNYIIMLYVGIIYGRIFSLTINEISLLLLLHCWPCLSPYVNKHIVMSGTIVLPFYSSLVIDCMNVVLPPLCLHYSSKQNLTEDELIKFVPQYMHMVLLRFVSVMMIEVICRLMCFACTHYVVFLHWPI